MVFVWNAVLDFLTWVKTLHHYPKNLFIFQLYSNVKQERLYAAACSSQYNLIFMLKILPKTAKGKISMFFLWSYLFKVFYLFDFLDFFFVAVFLQCQVTTACSNMHPAYQPLMQ